MKIAGNILQSICLYFLLTNVDGFQHSKFKSLDNKQTHNIIPGRFLIEYTTPEQHDNSLLSSLENQFQSLSLGDPYYNNEKKTNIRSVRVDDTTQHNNFLQTIVNDDQIVAVYPVTFIARPNSVSNGYYSNIDKNITETIQAHDLTQVNRLHKELGLTGKGIKICIIDSGVDYNHPALGGGFGPNYKISFGQDLVGNDFDPMSKNNTIPGDGSPPLDDCGKMSEKSGKL